jgi:hypothetical protein
MKTRIGKIAQLPKSTRDQLNRRLQNGQQSPELLRWLNELHNTKKLLAKKFADQPITKSNLSHWRHGGYLDWLADQARQAHIQRISESGASLEKAETGDLFENFARIAAAELMADLDSLQKLRDEKRTQYLHNLVRDLARLQNSYNRSRWAALAWEKWNDRFLGPDDYVYDEPETPKSKPDPSATALATVETRNATPCVPIPVVPDRTQSQATPPHDSQLKKPHDPFNRIYHTRCACGQPCPKCHAMDSDYPLDEVLRDQQFYRENGARNPYDRHGYPKHLMNYDCDCFCDRCAQKATSSLSADSLPGREALPRLPILLHAPVREENPQPSIDPLRPLSPSSPTALDPRSDFLRKMSHLKSASHGT